MMITKPIPKSVKQELARFEQLVADAYHAPIGKIDHADLDGWYGVRFSIGGHDFIVYQATDGSQDLGIDMTCQALDGHADCEDQFEMLHSGFKYVDESSDLNVVHFIRTAVARRFMWPYQLESRRTMKPLDSTDEKWNDYSTMKTLTCRNHIYLRYVTKNPWTRHIFLSTPEYEDCPCNFSDLVEVIES